jgi:hypothetical protein
MSIAELAMKVMAPGGKIQKDRENRKEIETAFKSTSGDRTSRNCSENHFKKLEEEEQAEVCMGTSVALKTPRDDENRAQKGSVGEEMVTRMRSFGDPGKTSFNRRRMCSVMNTKMHWIHFHRSAPLAIVHHSRSFNELTNIAS